MKDSIYIIAAEDLSSNWLDKSAQTATSNIANILKQSDALGFKVKQLQIDQLRDGWYTPISANHFRSGNGPLMAIEAACKELEQGNSDIVVINGCDNLKTDYSTTERHNMMAIYPECSLPEAYTNLAKIWCAKHQITNHEFIQLASNLFNNYAKTYTENTGCAIETLVSAKWFEFVTSLFRGVDCANPVVDFSGKIVLSTKDVTSKLSLNHQPIVEIAGIANQSANISGPNGINEIANFDHLFTAYNNACLNAKIDFAQLFKQHMAYLEVYTCFPIIPLAFVYQIGLATDIKTLEQILQDYPLTVTGGMNLAKAAWNLPVLRAIIVLYHKLLSNSNIAYAGVHGNGGLGEKQGFMILKKTV